MQQAVAAKQVPASVKQEVQATVLRSPLNDPCGYDKAMGPARVSIDSEDLQPAAPAPVKVGTPIINPYKRKRKLNIASVNRDDAFSTVKAGSARVPLSSSASTAPAHASPKAAGRDSKQTVVGPFVFTMLKMSVKAYVESGESDMRSKMLWKKLCQQLCVPVPNIPIQARYADPITHFQIRKALVVEEARETISRPLIELWQSKKRANGLSQPEHPKIMSFILNLLEVGKAESNGTRTLTFHRPFPPAGSGSKPDWFTKEEKEHLMTGSLFECSNLSEDSLENLMLAIVLPCQPKRINTRMEFDVKMSTDNRQIMESESMEWRLTPIGNMISYERQFAALCREPEKIAFLQALLGNGPTDGAAGAQTDSIVNLKAPNLPTHPNESSHAFGSGFTRTIPTSMKLRNLNAAQEIAITSFLDSPSGSISIIQGPPGTGKTTLLVSTIARFLMPAAGASNRRQRILVCAPTNKAVSLLALRFLEAASDSGVNIVLVGDDTKLLEESGGNNSPLFTFYIYSWSFVIFQEYGKILQFCISEIEPRKGSAKEMWEKSIVLRNRLFKSLLDLPSDFKKGVEALCATLEKCASGESPRTAGGSLVRSIITSFAEFPQEHVRTQILNSAHVIFSTLCSAACTAMLKMTNQVDALIVDEAAAATEPELYIAFQHGPSKLLVVGDPKQLQATVISKLAKRLGLPLSLHERLMYRCAYPYCMLDVQYRMHPEISQFPSLHFYDDKINNGENVLGPSHEAKALLLNRQPYVFWQAKGTESQDASGSWFNYQEADAVVSLVEDLRKAHSLEWCCSSDRLRIITFYQAQLAIVKKMLIKKEMNDVLVATVDASQGCEADVVIVSFVRSGNIPGFLTNNRRMNVALTRARHQLVCVGNVQQFPSMKNAATLDRLSADAMERNVVVQQERSV